MSDEEKKDTSAEAQPVPHTKIKATKKPAPPVPPKKPAAPSESAIKDKDAMPDLDAFNFMKW